MRSGSPSGASRQPALTLYKESMREILHEIQDGTFARDFILENQAGLPVITVRRRQGDEHLVEEIGDRLRGTMNWLDDDTSEK